MEDDNFGKQLQDKFPFYRKGYTKMAGSYYYANHCSHCGTIQGDWFVMEWVIEQQVQGKNPSRTVKVEIR